MTYVIKYNDFYDKYFRTKYLLDLYKQFAMMESKFWIVCLLGIIASTMACKGAENAGKFFTLTSL